MKKIILIFAMFFLFAIANAITRYDLVKVEQVGVSVYSSDSINIYCYINITINVRGNPYPEFYHTVTVRFDYLYTDGQKAYLRKRKKFAEDWVSANFPNI